MRRWTFGSVVRARPALLSASVVVFLAFAGTAAAASENTPVERSTGSEVSPATLGASGRDPGVVPEPGFRDNGDGTVSDLRTGLVWEKKCRACGGLHDVRRRFRWSGFANKQTIWDWLDEVNRENGSGFAGHSDWRIPNIKELVTLVDYGRSDPAAFEHFRVESDAHGCARVAEVGCSATANGAYWSSTTFSDFPAHALTVDFAIGFVDDRIKTLPRHVRAVRGGF